MDKPKSKHRHPALKCTENITVQCESCGATTWRPCPAPVAFVVFYGEDNQDPLGYCLAHEDRISPQWKTGKLRLDQVRKHNGYWEVFCDGKWLREDSDEYVDKHAIANGWLNGAEMD